MSMRLITGTMEFPLENQRVNPVREATFAVAGVPLRRGASWGWQGLMALLLALTVIALAGIVVGDVSGWLFQRFEVLVLLGGIGCWRWSWFTLQNIRAVIYRYWRFPRIRRQAARAAAIFGPVPEVTILAVTFKEKNWITQKVFESIFRELKSVPGLARCPRLVVVTGCDQDDEDIRRVYREQCGAETQHDSNVWPPELVLLRDDTGKRAALARALREIQAGNPHPEGVVVFMDGDTMLGPGLLKKVLPLFRLKPEVSAVTTNEDGWVKGPRWFAEWISLRFGLRHRTMCSVALSNRLLCLTGRLSIFRASVAVDPTFVQQIERDSIQHWLWDSFDMLSGDDKSTWYWLAARGRRMLYVPDTKVTTLEVVQGSALRRALANIRRWSGNSLRHSWRACRIGPQKLGWFCWYSLLDQRLAIFTVLVGPMFALLALCLGHFTIAGGYLLWVLSSRWLHAAISWRHGRRVSFFYPPLQILSDWGIALMKVWILFHPAKQAWLNRGARTLDSTKAGAFYALRTAAAHYLYLFTCVMIVLLIGVYTGFVAVIPESALFLRHRPGPGLNAQRVEPASPRRVVMFGQETRVQEDSDALSAGLEAAPGSESPSVVFSPKPRPQRRFQD